MLMGRSEWCKHRGGDAGKRYHLTPRIQQPMTGIRTILFITVFCYTTWNTLTCYRIRLLTVAEVALVLTL